MGLRCGTISSCWRFKLLFLQAYLAQSLFHRMGCPQDLLLLFMVGLDLANFLFCQVTILCDEGPVLPVLLPEPIRFFRDRKLTGFCLVWVRARFEDSFAVADLVRDADRRI